jgi:hypothetical protein
MAAITHLKTTPHTRIENTIIANMSEIGVYCYAVYCAIKMHLNQATGDCFPSYATIARITGIHRSTVIECVKKLRVLKLISPLWRFKEDGSHASNQYDFQQAGSSAPAKKNEEVGKTVQGSRPEPPPLVGEDDYPSRPERPEQSESNKKQRTISDVDFFAENFQQNSHKSLINSHICPSEKQRACPHPPTEIVFLAENVTICHHCYGLLDENLKLQEEETPSVEIVAA